MVGSADGGVSVYQSSEFGEYAATGRPPTPRRIATLDGPVRKVWALGDGRVAAYTDAGRLSLIDARPGGGIAARSTCPA